MSDVAQKILDSVVGGDPRTDLNRVVQACLDAGAKKRGKEDATKEVAADAPAEEAPRRTRRSRSTNG